jgi:hypothetical protein
MKQQKQNFEKMDKKAEYSIQTHKQETHKCKEVILDLYSRFMRENFAFYGITKVTKDLNENCSELVMNLIEFD